MYSAYMSCAILVFAISRYLTLLLAACVKVCTVISGHWIFSGIITVPIQYITLCVFQLIYSFRMKAPPIMLKLIGFFIFLQLNFSIKDVLGFIVNVSINLYFVVSVLQKLLYSHR